MARFDIADPGLGQMGGQLTADVFFELGLAYASGRDVEANLVVAHKWFNLAAHKGNGEAARHRNEIAGEMSAAEIAEAQRQAREFIRLN